MAGGDVLRAELVRALDEPAELQILVAHHARVRRAAGLVFIGEVLDDVLLKLGRFVDEVIRDAKLVADRPGVRDGLRSAALVFGAVDAVLRPELERDAHHVVALLQQQGRGGGGIHSSAHADHDACLLLRTHEPVNIRGLAQAVNGEGNKEDWVGHKSEIRNKFKARMGKCLKPCRHLVCGSRAYA